MRPFVAYLPVLLLLVGCPPDPASTVFVESRTEQGLLSLSREIAVARVERLAAENSVYFNSAIVPASATRVRTTGKLTVSQGAVELEFTDNEGKQVRVSATPGQSGSWEADLRTLRPREGRNGFLVKLRPTQGGPAQQVRVEVTYRPG